MNNSKRLLPLAVAAAIGLPSAAFATNGMNLEGYGPIATGMGGASMAYDNGTAAMANNPATLGFMADQSSRFDVALGFLGPNVSTKVPVTSGGSGRTADSSADAFYMPAIGWARKNGLMTYGAGIYAQGGMGTEYSADSDLAMGSGDEVRSEVGVARVIVPLAYQINDKLTVGGSLDWVRATMDLKMAVPAGAFAPSSMGGLVAGASAGWNAALAGLGGAGATWGRFDFSDDSDYGGMAQGTGFAGKLGFTFQATPELSIGGVYQNKTALGDLEATGATLSAGNAGGTLGSFHGDIKVRDFQWPTTIGLGMAYKASDAVLVVADVKQLQWSGVMEEFKMTFSSDAMGDLDVVMPQDWKDQTVVQLGVGYQLNPSWTLRAGYNHASNPVPDDTVSPLFPAIVETHYTFGAGYAINQASDVNFSYTLAPEVTVTGSGPMNNGMKISHSQSNWQLMYSNRF